MKDYINFIQEIISVVESNYVLYKYRGQNRLEVLMSKELFSDFKESMARDGSLKYSFDKKPHENTVAGMRFCASEKLRGCIWALASYTYGSSSRVFEYVSSYCEVDEGCLKTKTNQSLLSACNDVISCVESLGWVTKDCNAFDKLKLEISMQQ